MYSLAVPCRLEGVAQSERTAETETLLLGRRRCLWSVDLRTSTGGLPFVVSSKFLEAVYESLDLATILSG